MPAPSLIRILIVTSSSDIGGAERQVFHLARGLDRSRFDVAVLSLVGQGRLTAMLASERIRAINLGQRALPAAWRAAAGEVRSWRPHVAYLFGLRSDMMLRRVAAHAGAAVISGIRNTDPWRRPWHVALDRATAHHVRLFIANAQAGKNSRIWREGFPASRIVVVRNGIELPDRSDRENLRARFRARHRIERDHWLVGLVANYRPQKGHLIALDAFERAALAIPGLRMVFAGEDFMNGAIAHEIARRGLAERVLALPAQSDLAPLYAALDAFALPSDFEGTPNTLMEAMAWGVPSVSTEAGGIPEVLRGVPGGILIPPRDPAALSRALIELHHDGPDHPEWPAALRLRIESRFSVRAMVARHERLFAILSRKALA